MIEFAREQGKLSASASDMIRVRNEALGFNVHFLLLNFMLDEPLVSYSGRYRFEELEADSERQQSKWNSNRSKTYLGSLRHFMNSLANDKLNEHGFVVRFAKYKPTDKVFEFKKHSCEIRNYN